MNSINKKSSDTSMKNMWRLLMASIYLLFALVVLTLGYILLEDNIQAFINQKEYTKAELELLDKQAKKRIRQQNAEDNWDKVSNGIHVRTGLRDDPNLNIIIRSCTSCHSAKLITQNKATREGWKNMIIWMQKTQGLPDLGKYEPKILEYLAKYYAPKEVGRRKNIDTDKLEWYVLELN